MKKLVLTALLFCVATTAANALPSYLIKDGRGGYDVTYNYTDKPKNDWYMTFRAELSFLNWENKYSSDWPNVNVDFDHDKYSMEPVFGGSVSVGKKFGYHWRGEVEAGYNGMFTDGGAGFDFKFQTPYAIVNAIYDFTGGLYLGGGLGLALPIVEMNSDIFLTVDENSQMGISPMLGVMLGYTHKLDDNFVLDLRYRLAGFNGTKLTQHFEDLNDDPYYFETKIGLVLENSFSVGIRYEF